MCIMSQTFLRHFYRYQFKPVSGLFHCSFSVRVGQCQKYVWENSFRNNLTWKCTSARGYLVPSTRNRQLQLCSWPAATSSTSDVASCQVVMRTGAKQFSSQPEQKPPSPKESKNARHDDDPCVAPERLSLFKRFKQMYRDYWYVLIPVHVVTSIGWFGAFYYMCVSGVDVVAALESLNVSEKLINPLRDSKAGYVALSYAMYKIATPLRYTVTLGGTTLSINYLRKWGYIKPIPPREKLKEMYDEKKENLIERKDAIIKETAEQLKEHKESFMRSYRSKK